jgi:hypothetical protein
MLNGTQILKIPLLKFYRAFSEKKLKKMELNEKPPVRASVSYDFLILLYIQG